MSKKITILFSLIFLCLVIKSCSLPKGFEALEVYNYFKAKSIFEKNLERHPVAANYGLSLIYQRADNPFHNIDSAYASISYSKDYYDSLKPRLKDKYAEIKINDQVILAQQKLIEFDLYHRAIKLNTEQAFSNFITTCTSSELVMPAIYKRDSIYFEKVVSENTAKSYDLFISKYPNSVFVEEAISRFDRQLFNEKTADDQLKSFISFIKTFPDNPFVSEAQNKVYEIETESKSVISYELFIKRHPDNRNIRKAWQELYDAYLTENLNNSAIEDFIAKYPDNPFKNQVENDLELSKTTFYPVQKDGKWGFKSQEEKYMIDRSFDFVEPFSEELAAVTINQKVGYITKTGKQKIDFKFDDGLPFSEGCAIIELNGKYGMINRQGEYIILPEYEYLGELKNGLIPFEKDNLYGYFDHKGIVKIKPIFEAAYNFENGIAKISIGNKNGMINTFGKYIYEPVYESIYELDTGVYSLLQNGKWGALNIKQDTVIDFLYDNILKPSFGYYMITRNDSFNYIDNNKNFLLENWYPTYPEYKILGKYQKKPILVFINKGYNYVNTEGELIFKTSKESLGSYSQLIAYQKETLWGYLGINPAKEVIKPKFDKAESFNNGFGMVAVGPLWGLVNSSGKFELEAYYENIEFLTDSLLLVKGKGKHGIMNTTGDTLLPFIDDNIEPFRLNTVKVSNSANVSYYNYIENKWIRKEE